MDPLKTDQLLIVQWILSLSTKEQSINSAKKAKKKGKKRVSSQQSDDGESL